MKISASIAEGCYICTTENNFFSTFQRTSENQAGQGVNLDPERTKLHEQRWRGIHCTAYQQTMTVFWSLTHHHMTTNLMKLALGKRNVTT